MASVDSVAAAPNEEQCCFNQSFPMQKDKSSSSQSVLDDSVSLSLSVENANPADFMSNLTTQPKSMKTCLGTSSSDYALKLADLTKKQMIPI